MKHYVFSSDYSVEEQERIIADAIAEEIIDADITEDGKYRFLQNEKDYKFEDERDNLSLKKKVYAIGSVGLWNGAIKGFHKMENLNEVLWYSGVKTDDFSIELYVEDGELKSVVHHHDGSCYFDYYILDDNIDTEEFEDKLTELFEDGCLHDEEELKRFLALTTTNAGVYISELYGWGVPEKHRKAI